MVVASQAITTTGTISFPEKADPKDVATRAERAKANPTAKGAMAVCHWPHTLPMGENYVLPSTPKDAEVNAGACMLAACVAAMPITQPESTNASKVPTKTTRRQRSDRRRRHNTSSSSVCCTCSAESHGELTSNFSSKSFPMSAILTLLSERLTLNAVNRTICWSKPFGMNCGRKSSLANGMWWFFHLHATLGHVPGVATVPLLDHPHYVIYIGLGASLG